MNRFFYLFLVLLLTCQSGVFAQGGNNMALLTRVDSQIQHGQPKKALKLLNDRIATSDEDLELFTKRAEVKLILLKKKEAKAELRSVLAKDQTYGPALLTFAEYQLQEEHADSALWYINKALSYEQSSSVTEALYGLKGQIFMQMKDYEEAEANLYIAADRPEVSITTMRNFAAVLDQNCKEYNSLLVIKESMLMFGERLEPLINAGYICNKLEMYDEAIVHLKKALIQDPHQPQAHANIAEAYLYQGSISLAHEHIEKSLKNDKINSYAHKIRGDVWKGMNQPEKACKSYKRAFGLDYKSEYEEVSLIKIINETCGTRDGVVSEE